MGGFSAAPMSASSPAHRANNPAEKGNAMTVNGIDVSNWQGNFNWAAWKGRIGFASAKAAKAAEGATAADPRFRSVFFVPNSGSRLDSGNASVAMNR